LARQIEAIELLSGKSVVAVAINHENLIDEQIPLVCDAIEQAGGLPAFDVLKGGLTEFVNLIKSYIYSHQAKRKSGLKKDNKDLSWTEKKN
jgi:uncharacterized NAD-dependent epimerase/dehydratase family protein